MEPEADILPCYLLETQQQPWTESHLWVRFMTKCFILINKYFGHKKHPSDERHNLCQEHFDGFCHFFSKKALIKKSYYTGGVHVEWTFISGSVGLWYGNFKGMACFKDCTHSTNLFHLKKDKLFQKFATIISITGIETLQLVAINSKLFLVWKYRRKSHLLNA